MSPLILLRSTGLRRPANLRIEISSKLLPSSLESWGGRIVLSVSCSISVRWVNDRAISNNWIYFLFLFQENQGFVFLSPSHTLSLSRRDSVLRHTSAEKCSVVPSSGLAAPPRLDLAFCLFFFFLRAFLLGPGAFSAGGGLSSPPPW